MKTFSVLLTAFATVVVEAETEEGALECASENVDHGEFEFDEGKIEKELNKGEDLNSAKRHATVIFDYTGRRKNK